MRRSYGSLFLLVVLLGVGACGSRPAEPAADAEPAFARMAARFGAATALLLGERLTIDDDLSLMEWDNLMLGLGQGPLQEDQIRITSCPSWGDNRVLVLNLHPDLAGGAVFQVRRGQVVAGHAIAAERIAPVVAAVRASSFLDGGPLTTHSGLDGEMIHLEACFDGRRRRALLWWPIDPGAVAILRAAYTAAEVAFYEDGGFGTVLPEMMREPAP